MSGRGGSRHKAKPFIETGLLMMCLMKHEDLLVNFRGYETLSRNNGVDHRGLVHALDFINSRDACPAPQELLAGHVDAETPAQ